MSGPDYRLMPPTLCLRAGCSIIINGEADGSRLPRCDLLSLTVATHDQGLIFASPTQGHKNEEPPGGWHNRGAQSRALCDGRIMLAIPGLYPQWLAADERNPVLADR